MIKQEPRVHYKAIKIVLIKYSKITGKAKKFKL